MKEEKHELTTFADLNLDIEQAFKNDKFKLLLNQQPPETWINKNTLANNSKYLPIDKTEFLLDKIFQEWRIEVLREGTMFNSVYCTVRVHYLNPVTGKWSFHDGVGAKDLQHDKDTTLSMDTIKPAAVQMALPTAKSLAIKDACDHLGKLFGRDMNRKNTIEFAPAYMKNNGKPKPPSSDTKSEERIIKLVNNCNTKEEMKKFEKDCVSIDARKAYDEKFKSLK